MTKVVLMVVAMVGCASQRSAVSPAQQTRAMHMYCEGTSIDEVAASLAIDRGSARTAIHDALVELNRRFYR